MSGSGSDSCECYFRIISRGGEPLRLSETDFEDYDYEIGYDEGYLHYFDGRWFISDNVGNPFASYPGDPDDPSGSVGEHLVEWFCPCGSDFSDSDFSDSDFVSSDFVSSGFSSGESSFESYKSSGEPGVSSDSEGSGAAVLPAAIILWFDDGDQVVLFLDEGEGIYKSDDEPLEVAWDGEKWRALSHNGERWTGPVGDENDPTGRYEDDNDRRVNQDFTVTSAG